MARSGRDPSQFARDLLAHLRHLLVTQTTGEVSTTFVVTATDTERLRAQATNIGAATLIRTIDELADALTAVREGDDARMAVEIALLKAARPDLDPRTAGVLRRLERVEKLLTEGGQAAGPVTAGDPPPPPVAKASSGEVPPTVPPAAEASPEPGSGEASSETGPAGPSALSLGEIQQAWPAVLQKLSETSPALAATFDGARPVEMGDEGLVIGFPAGMSFNKRKAEGPERRDAAAAAFEAVVGQSLRPSFVLLEGDEEPPPDTPAPGSEEIDEEELLERLKSEFDAEEVS
jgi:DNA polymerase-3 subunit gamma/tau